MTFANNFWLFFVEITIVYAEITIVRADSIDETIKINYGISEQFQKTIQKYEN